MENKMKNTNIDCIGAIPIEWDVKPLKYLVRQPITDGPHETPEFTESGVPFLSVDGIQKGKLIFENTRFVSEYDANRYDLKVKPEFNDIDFKYTGVSLSIKNAATAPPITKTR